jgi:hypothetical protein
MASSKQKKILLAIAIPVLYAFFVRFIFGADNWQQFFAVMSVTFLFLHPQCRICNPAQNGNHLQSAQPASKISFTSFH